MRECIAATSWFDRKVRARGIPRLSDRTSDSCRGTVEDRHEVSRTLPELCGMAPTEAVGSFGTSALTDPGSVTAEVSATPEEQIGHSYRILAGALEADLLDRMREIVPSVV